MKNKCESCSKPFTPHSKSVSYGPVCYKIYETYSKLIDEMIDKDVSVSLINQKNSTYKKKGLRKVIIDFETDSPIVLDKSKKNEFIQSLMKKTKNPVKKIFYDFLYQIGHINNVLDNNKLNQAISWLNEGGNSSLMSLEEKKSIIDQEKKNWQFAENYLSSLKWEDTKGFEKVKKNALIKMYDLMYPKKIKAEKILCILCNQREATTREHPIKATSIPFTEEDGKSQLILATTVKNFDSPENALDNPPDLCLECNSKISQPYDKQYQKFIYDINLENPNYRLGKSIAEDSQEIFKETERITGLDRKITTDPNPDELEFTRFSKVFNTVLIERAEKEVILLKNMKKEDLDNIKCFLAKSMACFLNRSNEEIPKELREIFNSNKDTDLIKFALMRITYNDLNQSNFGIQANQDLVISEDKKTIHYTIVNGVFLIKVHFGEDVGSHHHETIVKGFV